MGNVSSSESEINDNAHNSNSNQHNILTIDNVRQHEDHQIDQFYPNETINTNQARDFDDAPCRKLSLNLVDTYSCCQPNLNLRMPQADSPCINLTAVVDNAKLSSSDEADNDAPLRKKSSLSHVMFDSLMVMMDCENDVHLFDEERKDQSLEQSAPAATVNETASSDKNSVENPETLNTSNNSDTELMEESFEESFVSSRKKSHQSGQYKVPFVHAKKKTKKKKQKKKKKKRSIVDRAVAPEIQTVDDEKTSKDKTGEENTFDSFDKPEISAAAQSKVITKTRPLVSLSVNVNKSSDPGDNSGDNDMFEPFDDDRLPAELEEKNGDDPAAIAKKVKAAINGVAGDVYSSSKTVFAIGEKYDGKFVLEQIKGLLKQATKNNSSGDNPAATAKKVKAAVNGVAGDVYSSAKTVFTSGEKYDGKFVVKQIKGLLKQATKNNSMTAVEVTELEEKCRRLVEVGGGEIEKSGDDPAATAKEVKTAVNDVAGDVYSSAKTVFTSGSVETNLFGHPNLFGPTSLFDYSSGDDSSGDIFEPWDTADDTSNNMAPSFGTVSAEPNLPLSEINEILALNQEESIQELTTSKGGSLFSDDDDSGDSDGVFGVTTFSDDDSGRGGGSREGEVKTNRMSEEAMTLTVIHKTTGLEANIPYISSDTLQDVKHMLRIAMNIRVSQQVLGIKNGGPLLYDSQTLFDYGIHAGMILTITTTQDEERQATLRANTVAATSRNQRNQRKATLRAEMKSKLTSAKYNEDEGDRYLAIGTSTSIFVANEFYEKAAGLYLELTIMDDVIVNQNFKTTYSRKASILLDRMEKFKHEAAFAKQDSLRGSTAMRLFNNCHQDDRKLISWEELPEEARKAHGVGKDEVQSGLQIIEFKHPTDSIVTRQKFYEERQVHQTICVGYHGTSTEVAVKIVKGGFRPMDGAPKNGNLYGNGVYIHQELSYSKNYSPEKNGIRIVLVTRFIKGKPFKSKKVTQSTDYLDQDGYLTGGDGEKISVVWWNNHADIQITHALVWVNKQSSCGGTGGSGGGGSGGGGSSGGGSYRTSRFATAAAAPSTSTNQPKQKFVAGDICMSAIDFTSANGTVKRGELGTFKEYTVDNKGVWRLRCSFPNHPNIRLLPAQLRLAGGYNFDDIIFAKTKITFHNDSMLVARGSQGIVVGPSRSGTQRGDRIQCRFVNCRANTSVPLTTISLAGGFVPGDNVVLKKASTVQKNKAHIPKDTIAVVISSYKLDNSRIRIKFKHHGILHVPALLLKRQGEQDDGCEVQ